MSIRDFPTRPTLTRRTLSLALAALISAAALALGGPAAAQSPVPGSSADALFSRAQAQGGIRVIVGLDMPVAPDGLLGPTQQDLQRSAISAVQDQVIGALNNGVDVVRRLETVPYMALRVTPAQLQALLADPRVTSVVEDVPLPPLLNTSTQLIGARGQWRRGIDGSDWAVAVLDTGIFYRHRAFDGALLNSACYSSNDPDAGITSLCPGGVESAVGRRVAPGCDLSVEGCGHGTHVSATVMAHSPRRIRGVAPAAQLIPVQVFSLFSPESGYCDAPGTSCVLSFQSDQLAGLERVAMLAQWTQIAAVNMSLGGGSNPTTCDSYYPAYTAVVNNLTAMGVAVIAASGNNGYPSSVAFPACISNVIAVGATDDDDAIAWFSNQAPGLTRLMAPGVEIEAAYDGARNTTSALNGTSMAAPHVAGAFALLRQAAPDASVAQILAALECTGTPVRRAGTEGRYPRININAARLQVLWGRQPGC